MTKYLQSVHELVEELARYDKKEVHKWVEKYLFHGFTGPLLGFNMNQSKSTFITQLADQSGDNTPLKKNLEKAVANCYNKIFDYEGLSLHKGINKEKIEIMIELFVIVGRVEINDMFERLKKDALSEKYKGIDVGRGTRADLHTFLLKSLFALEKNKDIHSLTQIIDRDIHYSKYSLECFEISYSSVGQKISGIKYIPILVNQIEGANRDVVGTLKDYIKILEKEDLSCFNETPEEKLTNGEIKKFSYMLNILNKHMNKYDLENENMDKYKLKISEDGLMIQNIENQKTRFIPMKNKLTGEIRSSLKYIPNQMP